MKTKLMSDVRLSVLTLLVMIGNNYTITGQVMKPFTQRASANTPTKLIYNIKGDYTMIGNTNLTLDVYGDNNNNSNNMMHYVDVDGNNNTLNSSSATLTFSTENGANPSCSRIIYAGLYWTGRSSNASTSPESFTVNKGSVSKNYNKRTVSLKGPGQTSYTQLVADPGNIYYPTNSEGLMYSAYVEVTDYVKANGLGEYTVADIALIEGNGGSTGYYGGWGMVVIYENIKMNWRDITLFDGHAYVTGNETLNYELPVSGFNTAQSGPVNLKLGLMAGEGDVGISGDYFKIRNYLDNSWIALNHTQNSNTNFFNGSVNTGGNSRNPNLKNNTGLDIASFYVPNAGNSVITNKQTSTKFQYGSTQDTYIIFCIAMAVDAYVPDIELQAGIGKINGQPTASGPLIIKPGQDFELKLKLKNLGTEAVDNMKVVVPIPYGTSFIPGSEVSKINFTPNPVPNKIYIDSTIGPTGSVIWEFGTLPKIAGFPDSLLAELTLQFTLTTDCYILKNADCELRNLNLSGGVLSGTGSISGVSFTNKPSIQGYKTSGGCIGEPISDPILIAIDADNCQNVNQSVNKKFVFCNYTAATIPFDSISTDFPLGVRFYNTNNFTSSSVEYNSSNPFPATHGTHIYFAIPVGINSCYYTFTISVSDMAAAPQTSDLMYCLNDKASKLTAVKSDPSDILYFYSSINSTSPQYSITPSTTIPGVTTYYVAEGDSNCISPNRDSIRITVYDLINVSAIAQTNVLCKNQNTGVATVIASGSNGDFSYTWNTTPPQTTATATGLAVGSYIVTANSSIGCSVPATAVVTITEPSLELSLTITSQSNVLCNGSNTGSATVMATGGSLNYTYSWNTIPVQNIATATGLTAGLYTVTVTDTNGCTASENIEITQPDSLIALVTTDVVSGGYNISCNGINDGSINLNIAGRDSTTYAYSWTGPNGFISNAPIINNLFAGTYHVSVTDSNGCTAAASITLTQPDSLQSSATIISNYNGYSVSCAGSTDGITNLTVIGGALPYSYTWSNGSTTEDLQGIAAGNYAVSIADANGCHSIASVTLTEPLPILGTTIINDVLCNGHSTGSIDLTITGGVGSNNYQWSSGETSEDIFNHTSGTYTVTVADNNQCTFILNATVKEAFQIMLNIVSTNETCFESNDGTAQVIANGGVTPYTFIWSNGMANDSISGLASGDYIVTVTDQNNCFRTDTIKITQPDSMIAVVSSPVYSNGHNVTHFQSSDGAIEMNVNGGTTPYIYSWNNGTTTQNVSQLPAGIYNAIITDTSGCVATASITLTQPDDLAMPTGYSPNGDGKNDVFIVHGLEAFPDNKIIVVNRWGSTVFKANAYQNNWYGVNSSGEPLPDGTYFVVLTINEGDIILKGYVDIRR